MTVHVSEKTDRFILEKLCKFVTNVVRMSVALPRIWYVVNLSKNCSHQQFWAIHHML
jgi:hypothetical protein